MTARLLSTDATLAAFADEVGSTGTIAISGNHTRWDIGGVLDEGTRTISAPAGIVDYVPDEMIVTVRAGTPVADLHAELATHGQWTALPERGGTVGGAIAVGQNDFRRLARGDVRSSVLQVRYVSSDGNIITGGGPTVKNVSGFDLPRLLTGSLGTLGCIAEVILRTNPIPREIRWLSSDDADPFAVHRSILAPGSILWDGTATTVMLVGHRPAVDDDIAILQRLGKFTERDEPLAPEGHRWSLTPDQLRNLPALGLDVFVAEVGVGIVHADVPQNRQPLSPTSQLIHERLKDEFDPLDRFNPGRMVGVR